MVIRRQCSEGMVGVLISGARGSNNTNFGHWGIAAWWLSIQSECHVCEGRGNDL